jgi:hypothetical protein
LSFGRSWAATAFPCYKDHYSKYAEHASNQREYNAKHYYSPSYLNVCIFMTLFIIIWISIRIVVIVIVIGRVVWLIVRVVVVVIAIVITIV